MTDASYFAFTSQILLITQIHWDPQISQRESVGVCTSYIGTDTFHLESFGNFLGGSSIMQHGGARGQWRCRPKNDLFWRGTDPIHALLLWSSGSWKSFPAMGLSQLLGGTGWLMAVTKPRIEHEASRKEANVYEQIRWEHKKRSQGVDLRSIMC